MSNLYSVPQRPTAPLLVGDSQVIEELRATIGRVAAGGAKVLISGESGVGKDVIARCIHASSERRHRPFVPVNCAAVSDTLLESEMFGHVRGSFTGAYKDRPGKLQAAHMGTLLLDEVGEMSLRMQALLLRFLEDGEIQPIGCDQAARTADVRIIAATNRDLADLIAAGRFREDLMYRLKVVHIRVPPLRERREDVRALVQHAIARTGRTAAFTPRALSALERYHWPGNVRELQNVVEQALWTTAAPIIDAEHLPAAVRSADCGCAVPTRERRRQLAEVLFFGLQTGCYSFWDHVHRPFLKHDLTRQDVRGIVRGALAAAGGNYRAVVRLLGMEDRDYKRFMNFLDAHDCAVDFRTFRAGATPSDTDGPLMPVRPEAPAVARQ